MSETTSEMATATLKTTANSRNNRPTMPPISRIGIKTATSEVLMERTVNPISSRAFQRRLVWRHAGFEIARDVLDHHDGIVNDETGDDGERHQRQIVDRIAEQIHHAESAHQRDRHGDCGNNRGANVSQENENHQNHQERR